MTRLSFTNRLVRSAAKRADAVLSRVGLPGYMPASATHARCHRQWLASNGDQTHRLDYQLAAEDIVFDVGGFRGDWTAEIDRRFGSQIHIFEPVNRFYQSICTRFANSKNITPHCFGLSAKDETISLAVLGDSTSQFKESKDSEVGHLRSITHFLTEHQIDRVALLKLNIEGGEYDLLESLLETGLIKRFENIQVQFHWFVPNARQRMKAIQAALQKTHGVTYQYEFVWENWAKQAA